MEKRFFAKGKLMLSGEYAVLKGALALSLPCRYGQHLLVLENKNSKEIIWESFDEMDQIWFQIRLDLDLNILDSSSTKMANNLQAILKNAFEMSMDNPEPLEIRTQLDFNREWGLGSSSTLIHLISQWLKIDAMDLFFKVSNGSGYDVAAAGCSKPIIYQLLKSKANWKEVEIPQGVFENCFFIHLNQKQKSDLEVAKFKLNSTISEVQIEEISNLTENILQLKNERQLQNWIRDHEILMTKILGQSRIQDRLFPDFEGQLKSLGAWGGDFIMASGINIKSYFASKGFHTIIPFYEMIISNK